MQASKGSKSISSDTKLEAKEAEGFQAQLKAALHKNLARVIDIFRDWDEDFSGTIDRKEFRKAIKSLGFDAPREEVATGLTQRTAPALCTAAPCTLSQLDAPAGSVWFALCI